MPSQSADETLSFLISFVREAQEIGNDDPDFGPDVDVFDYGYLDSFGIVNLIEAVRVHSGVDLGDLDFYGADVRTLRKLATHIDAMRGER
jgi:acyl carrier protein